MSGSSASRWAVGCVMLLEMCWAACDMRSCGMLRVDRQPYTRRAHCFCCISFPAHPRTGTEECNQRMHPISSLHKSDIVQYLT